MNKEFSPEFAFTNIPSRWTSERYYDEIACECIGVEVGSTIILEFPRMQPGLIVKKYGFMWYGVGAANLYLEYTFSLMNQYLVSLNIGGRPIEGYTGKYFPITGYIEPIPAQIANIHYRPGSIFNPSMLVDLEIPINAVDTRVYVEGIATAILPDNICLCARLIGKYIE